MCSKVTLDQHGRPIVVVTSPTIPELPVGMRFVLRGNAFDDAGHACWLGVPTGRPPLPAEQASGAYCTPVRPAKLRPQPEPDDDELPEAQAIEFARREQQREPVSLVA
jgi:hypothetical protein